MSSRESWLVLIHHLPPDPAYLRAKIHRRLNHLGAIPLKRSAYYLPSTDSTMEEFQWLHREITEAGGSAWLLEATFHAGLQAEDAREAFRDARAADYAALAADARALLDRIRARTADAGQLSADLRRLERRLDATRRIDFFQASGNEEVTVLLQSASDAVRGSSAAPSPDSPARDFKGRVWMTRPGVRVDRMASAWLIRRFIDPAATFILGTGDPPRPGVIRFDMYEGEFTHQGDLCTFEVLLRASQRTADQALVAIAEMVHDLDFNDERYQRPETGGLAAMLSGVVARHQDDARRIADAAPLFDALYQHFTLPGRP